MHDNKQYNLGLLTLDPEDEINYTFLKTIQNQFQCLDFMRDFEQALYQKMLNRFNKNCRDFTPEDFIFPIETIPADDITAAEFKHKISQKVVAPFIIKGFLTSSKACAFWDLDYFKKHYPHMQVSYCVTHKDGRLEDALFGEIAEIIQQMQNPNNEDIYYIHNTSQIFKDHPELLKQLNYEKLCSYYKPIAVNAIVQLFMGGPKTGVQLHCANEFNSFLMINGKKHWTFIAPEYSYALMAELSVNMLNALTNIPDHQKSFDYFEQHNPLYNRIPKLTATIEPGDMLVFAPWWWHAVTNVSPSTIAVATRWTALKSEKFPRGNPIFQNIQRSNPHFKEYSKLFVDKVSRGEFIGDAELQRDTFGQYRGKK